MAIIPGNPGRKDFSLLPTQDIGDSAGCPLFFSACLFCAVCLFFFFTAQGLRFDHFKQPVLNRHPAPARREEMAHSDFAYRPSAVASNDPWLTTRRWEQTLEPVRRTKSLCQLTHGKARSTMMHTRTPCSTRAPVPIGSRGKMASQA